MTSPSSTSRYSQPPLPLDEPTGIAITVHTIGGGPLLEVCFEDIESGRKAWTGTLDNGERRRLARRLTDVAAELLAGLPESGMP